MPGIRGLMMLVVSGIPWLGGAALADQPPLSTEDRVTLQASMAQYIDQHTIGDAFLHIDPKTGDVQKLYPVSQHPMIVQMKSVLVLRADLRTSAGETVNADFYATRDGNQFVIFQSEIGNRAPLTALIMKGAASLLQ